MDNGKCYTKRDEKMKTVESQAKDGRHDRADDDSPPAGEADDGSEEVSGRSSSGGYSGDGSSSGSEPDSSSSEKKIPAQGEDAGGDHSNTTQVDRRAASAKDEDIFQSRPDAQQRSVEPARRHGQHHQSVMGKHKKFLNHRITEIENLYEISRLAARRAHDNNNSKDTDSVEAKAPPARQRSYQQAETKGNNQESSSSRPQNLQPSQQGEERRTRPKSHADDDCQQANQHELYREYNYGNTINAYSRPFFQGGQAAPAGLRFNGSDGSGAHSSSGGFTSFFTTTKSESNGQTGSSSDQSTQKIVGHIVSNVPEAPRALLAIDSVSLHLAGNHAHASRKDKEADDLSDSSSMVVLARVKRKHDKQAASSNSDGGTGNGSSNNNSRKRVRINEDALPATPNSKFDEKDAQEHQKQRNLRAESSAISSLSTSLDTSGSDSGQAKNANDESLNTDQKQSSASDANQTTQTAKRLVTDSSGTTTANGSTGSGTGSGNNDNQELKPSSQSNARNEIEECEPTSPSKSPPRQRDDRKTPPEELAESKLSEKKRKRRVQRREYEEGVQRQMRDSSETTSSPDESPLLPGQPVSLEDVLSFTKTARILVQAIPPFLAVHVNAAFTTLCGIQSSAAIGSPVSAVISLPAENPPSSGSDNTDSNKDAMSSLSDSDGNRAQNEHGNVAEPQDPSTQGLRIDRLIVARGYDNIHNVEIISVPLQSHSHVIEGSVIRYTEGNGKAKKKLARDTKIPCRMTVSPVLSTPQVLPSESRNNHCEPKRRKIRPDQNESSLKHFLIQLERSDGPKQLHNDRASYSDTSEEAQMNGVTKTEIYSERGRLERRMQQPEEQQEERNDNNTNTNESDSPNENGSGSNADPVTTCG